MGLDVRRKTFIDWTTGNYAEVYVFYVMCPKCLYETRVERWS